MRVEVDEHLAGVLALGGVWRPIARRPSCALAAQTRALFLPTFELRFAGWGGGALENFLAADQLLLEIVALLCQAYTGLQNERV
jgi:hypothetical protein